MDRGRVDIEFDVHATPALCLPFDEKQRKKTRPSCVVSLNNTFTVRDESMNGPPGKSEVVEIGFFQRQYVCF